MKIIETHKCPVIDSHIHYAHPSLMQGLVETCNKLKIDRFNIVCTPHRERLSLVPDALHLKAHYPKRVFVFGGLDVSVYFRDPQRVGLLLADYIDLLSACGCDGIKMIEGKPDTRKMFPIPPFDSDAFAPYWEKLARTQMPLVMHVNDPEEFWDANRAPEWARERGWFYGDGTYINNEVQYREIFNVLAKNPNLKVIFAHFFFMSAQLSRLADLLERYPNMYIDLTPGIEMYRNFSEAISEAREFFLKYQNRIVFGTDIGARALLVNPEEGIQYSESHERVFLVQNFLENEGEFYLNSENTFLFGNQEVPFLGLGLPVPVLERIYYKNFEGAVGLLPKPLNPGLIVEMCNQIERMIEFQGSSQPGVPGDPSVVQTVKSYFESIC